MLISVKETEEDKAIDQMPAEEVADEEIEAEGNENRDNAEEEVDNNEAEDNENRANADEEVNNNEGEEVQEEEIEENKEAKGEDSEQVGLNIVLKLWVCCYLCTTP